MDAYSADRIFTGNKWLAQHALLVDDGVVTDLLPIRELQKKISARMHVSIIAPAFIDLQIYGAAGRLFSAYPSAHSLHKLYDHCKAGGTHHFLPTIATNTSEIFYRCIDAIKNYWAEKGQGVLGLHVEGPWINKLKKGAHIESLIHSPAIEEVKELLSYGKGIIKMITLAPEVCSREVLQLISSEKIIISAGHSNANYQQGIDAFNMGIPAATHLFNAMSPLHHREPGLPAAIMLHPSVMASIIPDGYHVNFEIITIAKKLMQERLFIITDAVTETTEGPYPHTFCGDKFESNGILSGSALTQSKGIKNLVEKAGISLDEALRMASYYPAKLIGNNRLGKIEGGQRAEFVCLDEKLEIVPM